TQTIHWGWARHITLMCVLYQAIMMLNGALAPYRWNWSASVPVGLYYMSHRSPEIGELVAFCLPKEIAQYAKARGYIGFGFSCPGWTQPLLKPVVATAGDSVAIAPAGVTVRGVTVSNTRVFTADSQGRPQVVWIAAGEHIVTPGF